MTIELLLDTLSLGRLGEFRESLSVCCFPGACVKEAYSASLQEMMELRLLY